MADCKFFHHLVKGIFEFSSVEDWELKRILFMPIILACINRDRNNMILLKLWDSLIFAFQFRVQRKADVSHNIIILIISFEYLIKLI